MCTLSVVGFLAMLVTVVVASWPQTTVGQTPMTVTVEVTGLKKPLTISGTTTHGLLTEVLASVSARTHTTFLYSTRSSSIFPQSFLGQANDAAGRWEFRLNGNPVSDLANVQVRPTDRITAHYTGS